MYLAYDIEIFKENALVIFKTLDKKVYRMFHNKFNGLYDVVKNHTLIGYNNHYYDDKILSAMLDNYTPHQLKKLNDEIIQEGKKHPIKAMINSLDCFQQIDVGRPSLKKIEGNMGKKIFESSIAFDINRALTDDELQEVIEYCCYDIDLTIDVYHNRVNSYFKPKEMLVSMLGNDSAKKWNTTTISANILVKKPLPKWSSHRIDEKYLDMVPYEVVEFWEKNGKTRKGTLTIDQFDNEIVFAFGGLHGAHKSIKKAENVKLLDVTSMYPSIILNLNLLGQMSYKYREILDQRIKVKHTDKVLSDALKLILNSVSGNLDNQYSVLNNPNGALSLRMLGQIALYKLCELIAPFVTIININTDGVAFISDNDLYKSVIPEWEELFNLELEEDNFKSFYQKDVNNYVGVMTDGKLKCKGGDVTRYHKDALFKNNNARILDIALVNKLVHGVDFVETLETNVDNPILYQYILQAGGTYKGTCDDNHTFYNKVNRIFAGKKTNFRLYKCRHDDGLVRFADTPNDMFLWNGEVDEIEDFKDKIDLNHYYQILVKRLERWE